MCLVFFFKKKERKEEKIFLFSPSFDFRCNREETLLRVEEWKERKWVKCKWTPPSHPVTIALVLQEVFEVLISRLWFHSPRKGTLGSGEAFHDSFMPSWNSSKVFGIISTGVNTMLLQLLSCIIQEVNWSSVLKLKMLISIVWNYWCKTQHSSPLSYSKTADKKQLQMHWKALYFYSTVLWLSGCRKDIWIWNRPSVSLISVKNVYVKM